MAFTLGRADWNRRQRLRRLHTSHTCFRLMSNNLQLQNSFATVYCKLSLLIFETVA